MFTDRLFVIFGSDSRFEYTAEALREKGFEVCSFSEIPPARLNELAIRHKALVLPLPFTRDNKSVNLPLLPYTVTLKGILSILRQGDLVFGGLLNEDFISQVEKRSAKCFDYYDENMILENAELTALALIKLLDELKLDRRGLEFAVTGFGRTAKAIAHAFSDSGISFSIIARGEKAQADAKACGYDFVGIDFFSEKAPDLDVVINTVPALILNGERLSSLKRGALIIDIASSPYGVTQEDAEKYGIKLIRALSLPGRYFPEQAGRLIADSIEQLQKGR